MMYHKNNRLHMNVTDMRMQRRVLALICAVLLVATVAFAITAYRNGAYRGQAQEQFQQRMLSAVSSAIDEVNRMAGMVTSTTTARLAKVRQYVYYMEQLNSLSMALEGGENGRLAPAEAFTALYGDLEAFESLTQAATSSTLDTRTQLLTHLTTLQTLLAGQ